MKKLLPLFLLLIFCLTACTPQGPEVASLFAMDTFMDLKIWGDASALDALQTEIRHLENLFSVTDENSALAMLNATGTAELTEEMAVLLQEALEFSAQTEGAFDPTLYPLSVVWGFPEKNYRIPEAEVLDALLPLTGAERVHLSGTSIHLDAGTSLDFGGIAKGYAARRCVQLLEAMNVEAALLSLGGNVQTYGTKPDGSAWVIGLADPDAPNKAIATLSFRGTLALVTSGSYQRYFTQDGVTYHHILDPDTGAPARSGLCSVTVICDDGAMADAYSTALFVMGLEKSTEFYRTQGTFEAIFITDAREIYVTGGCADLLSGCNFTIITKEASIP